MPTPAPTTFAEGIFKPGDPRAVEASKQGNAKRWKGGPNGMELCKQNEILQKMVDVGLMLYGILAHRQQTQSPEVFAADEKNIKLAVSTMDSLDKVAQYGYQKLNRLDHVGDAPQTTIENRFVFQLKLGTTEQPGRPVNGNAAHNGGDHAGDARGAAGESGNGHVTIDAIAGREPDPTSS
jgi:hypothetical protein